VLFVANVSQDEAVRGVYPKSSPAMMRKAATHETTMRMASRSAMLSSCSLEKRLDPADGASVGRPQDVALAGRHNKSSSRSDAHRLQAKRRMEEHTYWTSLYLELQAHKITFFETYAHVFNNNR
jgi:hypothetical protein